MRWLGGGAGVTAEYRCLACEHEYTQCVGTWHPAATTCPNCGHLYIKWLNYDAFDLSKSKGHPKERPLLAASLLNRRSQCPMLAQSGDGFSMYQQATARFNR